MNCSLDSIKTCEESVPLVDKPVEGNCFYKKTGPVPLQEKYPELLTVIMDFVKMNDFAAHARRRTGTATTCGVRLADIRQHVLDNVEGLTEISRTKIYYFLKPSSEKTREAAKHKDALDVRVDVNW